MPPFPRALCHTRHHGTQGKKRRRHRRWGRNRPRGRPPAHRQGATAHAVDLHTDALEASDHLIPHQLNITDRDALSALAEQTGPVDAVVNVAGIVQDFVDIADLDREAFTRVMDVKF